VLPGPASLPVRALGLSRVVPGDRKLMAIVTTSTPLEGENDPRWRHLNTKIAALLILLIIPLAYTFGDSLLAYASLLAIPVAAVMVFGGNLNAKLASLPMMFIVLGVFVGGTIWTMVYSFTKSTTLPFLDFVGFAQYVRLWKSDRWQISIENLAIYGVFYVIIAFIVGFLLAVFMDQKIRAEGVFRSIYLYPFALSLVVTGHVWAWIMSPAFGLEATVRSMGWTTFNFDWLTNRHMVMYAVLIAGLWQGTGLVMALMLAGLRGIDDEIWKAAKVDGIPKWRTYIQIVLPMMRPVLITTFVIVASSAVRIFDLVVALTQGGPGLSSEVPSKYVYEFMFVGNLAQGLAASTMMLLTTAIILIPWIWVEFGKARAQR